MSNEGDEKETIINDLLSRHKDERCRLAEQIKKLELSSNGKGKNSKKQLAQKIKQLESSLKMKHASELHEAQCGEDEEDDGIEMRASSKEPETVPENGSPPVAETSSSAPRRSKAASRRERKSEKANALMSVANAPVSVDPRKTDELRILSDKIAGLNVVEIEGDGDCLFSALVDQLRLMERPLPSKYALNAQGVRDLICDTLIEARTDFEVFIDGDFEEYVHRMRTTRCWGGDVEISAFARALNASIRVIQAEGSDVVISHSTTPIQTFTLVFYRHLYRLGGHYNSARPANLSSQPL